MIDKILTWLLTKVLDYLISLIESKATKVSNDMATEKERNKTNEKNIIKYEAARARAEKIKAAKHLLNNTNGSDAG